MTENPARSGDGLWLATYNIHRAIGTDRRLDPRRIVSVLREMNADIIGLQEVAWRQKEGNVPHQLDVLARLGGYTSVLGGNLLDHRGHFGNMLLSRCPVVSRRLIDLAQPRAEPRGAIDAVIAAPGGSLRVIVTHLGLRVRERRRQAAKLRDLLESSDVEPVVLLGDFNDWLPTMPTLRPLLERCRKASAVPSYPSPLPVLALDRILLVGRGSLAVSGYRSRLARVASDHLPICGRFRF